MLYRLIKIQKPLDIESDILAGRLDIGSSKRLMNNYSKKKNYKMCQVGWFHDWEENYGTILDLWWHYLIRLISSLSYASQLVVGYMQHGIIPDVIDFFLVKLSSVILWKKTYHIIWNRI